MYVLTDAMEKLDTVVNLLPYFVALQLLHIRTEQQTMQVLQEVPEGLLVSLRKWKGRGGGGTDTKGGEGGQ